MPNTIGTVSIRCIEPDANYLLEFKGTTICETLHSVEEAVKRAGELVVEETRFTLYSKAGEALVTGMLFPNEFTEKEGESHGVA